MSFYDSVNTLLEKNKIKLDYPINIVMGYKNSNFIDIELYEPDKKIVSIDEILNNITGHSLLEIYNNAYSNGAIELISFFFSLEKNKDFIFLYSKS